MMQITVASKAQELVTFHWPDFYFMILFLILLLYHPHEKFYDLECLPMIDQEYIIFADSSRSV